MMWRERVIFLTIIPEIDMDRANEKKSFVSMPIFGILSQKQLYYPEMPFNLPHTQQSISVIPSVKLGLWTMRSNSAIFSGGLILSPIIKYSIIIFELNRCTHILDWPLISFIEAFSVDDFE